MKYFILIIIATISVVMMTNRVASSEPTRAKETFPVPCTSYDSIHSIDSCKGNFKCVVTLKSGRVETMTAPIIGEVVPCKL